jgi:Trk K+ transport system NAD-binding subunit
VARIVRNGMALKGLPGPEDRFEPHDKVSVMGTDEQIASVKKVIKLTLG